MADGPSTYKPTRRDGSWLGYGVGATVVTLATLVSWFFLGREYLADVVMLYLLGVVVIALKFGFLVSTITAVLSVLAFDIFFIPPYLTLTVSDWRHAVTFIVMLLVAVVIAGLTERVRNEAEIARTSERRTTLLYAMSRELSQTDDRGELIRAAVRHMEQAFDAVVTLRPAEAETTEGALRLPLRTSEASGRLLGVLEMVPRDPARFDDPEQQRLADALAAQLTVALQRTELTERSEAARLQFETERLRSTLLSSISHDLRTPLAVMKGVASTLVDDEATLSAEARRDLTATLLEETEHLEQLVQNVLTMTRLESGSITLKKELQSVEELIGGALYRVERFLRAREVRVKVPRDLFVPCDAVLIEQLLVNLLENAAKHTPEGSPVDVNARVAEGSLVIEVADRGGGLEPANSDRAFEKFHRGAVRHGGGVGLGLAICRAIADAHGGRISARNRPGGGTSFELVLSDQQTATSGESPAAAERVS